MFYRLSFFSFLLTVLSCGGPNSNQSADETPSTQQEEHPSPAETDTANEVQQYLENFDFNVLIEKYEDPERRMWQNPDLVLDKLGDLSGLVVADIGAGTGYFTFRMAENAHKVIAIDVDSRFLEYIEERKREMDADQAGNIDTRLTTEDDPSLRPNEADIALVVNTYHFIENRADYFEKVKKGLKDSGRLAIVDFKAGNMPVGPPEELKVSPETALKELRQAGFQQFSIDSVSLQYQYIIIAE